MDFAWSDPGPAARHQPLVSLFAAGCCGVILDRYCSLPFGVVFVVGVVVWIAWFCLWRRKMERTAVFALLTAAACIGALWHHARWNSYEPNDVAMLARNVPTRVCLEATVLSAPTISPAPPRNPMNPIPQGDATKVRLQVHEVRDGLLWHNLTGDVSLTIDGHLLDIYVGDRVRVFGVLNCPEAPRNVGEVDRRRILRVRGELCSLRAKHPNCVQVVLRGSWASVRRWFYEFRADCNRLLWKNVDHEQAGLAAAVLLGARQQVDRRRNEDFFLTGTIHLLAISGLHVGMLAYMIWMVARSGIASRNGAILITAISIVLYAMLTNSRPPVIRATILIVAFCAARLSGRQAFSFNTLAMAGLVVLLMNPAELFRTGTQLSFLAVATLACSAPLLMPPMIDDPLDRLIANSRPWPVRVLRRVGSGIRRLWLTSTVIWLVALPLVLYHFHLVSPVAIFLNPVLMIPIAFALFGGFGVLVFGWLLPPLGWLFGWICGVSLWLIESCVQTAKPIYGSYAFLPAPAIWWVVATYVALAALVYSPRWRPPLRWCVATLLLWIAIGLQTMGGDEPRIAGERGELNCTFLAVGHGTSVVLELPNGQTLLYDAGRLGDPDLASRAVANYLWSRGKTHLDAVVISHADADHYNALPGLLECVSVGVVYVSPVMFDDPSQSLERFRQAVVRSGTPIRLLSAGQRLKVDKAMSIQALHPPKRGVAMSSSKDVDNANSIVLQLDYQGRRILLPGDLEPPGLSHVLSRPKVDCDIVMAPHHGSLGSDPSEFSKWSSPDWVVISSGYRSGMNEVNEVFRETGAEVLYTARDGAIQVTIASGNLSIHSWDESGWSVVQ